MQSLHQSIQNHNTRVYRNRTAHTRHLIYTALISSLLTLLAYSYVLELTLLK